MSIATADLCDHFIDSIQVAEPLFRSYGAFPAFHGQIETVKVFEDNVLVKSTLATRGNGKVLVVDGGGSLRCALLGDNLATMAQENGWSGVVVYGCIRDSAEIAGIRVGVKALNTCPAKSIKRGEGQKNLILRFAGAIFKPGEFLYADEDGIVVSPVPLKLPD